MLLLVLGYAVFSLFCEVFSRLSDTPTNTNIQSQVFFLLAVLLLVIIIITIMMLLYRSCRMEQCLCRSSSFIVSYVHVERVYLIFLRLSTMKEIQDISLPLQVCVRRSCGIKKISLCDFSYSDCISGGFLGKKGRGIF